MPFSLFEHSNFLQAVGWGILHSFWQTALFWILFKILTAGNQNSSSSFRHHLGIFSLLGSLLGFVFTVANQYSALKNGQSLPVNLLFFNFKTVPEFNKYILPLASFSYFLLLVFYVLQFSRQYFSLYNIRNAKLVKAPVDIRLFAEQMAFRMGIKKNVTCWLSAKVDAPFVTGFFKPVILLPFSLLNHLTITQAEAVILHELAHVKRNDYLVNIFQLIAEKLLFFNPFARLLSEAAKVEREHCCDDLVLQFKFNQHEYAHALLQVEQLRSQQLVLAMNATSGKKKLFRRIKRIFSTEPAIEISGGQKIKLATIVAGMLVALVLLVPVTKNELFTLTPVSIASVYTASDDVAIVKKEQHAVSELLPAITTTEQLSDVLPKVKEQPVQIQEAPVEITEDEPAPIIMLNEDLLEAPAEPIATPIPVNDQAVLKSQVMVRVEEEISGSKQKKVYYIQLSNTNGQTEIRPLAMVKQPVADSLKNLTGTAKQNPATSKKSFSKKAI